MGTLEISIIIALIATIGHFLTWWVAYLEKKFEMEEVMAPLRKRREKKRAKGKLAGDDEEDTTEQVLEKELGYRKPTFWDLLPFVLYRLAKRFIFGIPERIKKELENRREEKERLLREEEEERERQALIAEKQSRPKKVKQPKKLRDASEFENEEIFQLDDSGMINRDTEGNIYIKESEWTEEDYAALAKAMSKFPGGTPGRWDRIAHELGRRPDEVTKKVKEMKTTLASNATVSGSDQLLKKKKHAVQLSDTLITKAIDHELNKTKIISDSDLYQSQYDIPDDYDEGFDDQSQSDEEYVIVPKKEKVKTRPVTEEPKTDVENDNGGDKDPKIEVDSWSQVQQKCLEAAILQFPKSTLERWTCIARAVPDKTKEQCIARYKQLVEHIKQKKQSKGS